MTMGLPKKVSYFGVTDINIMKRFFKNKCLLNNKLLFLYLFLIIFSHQFVNSNSIQIEDQHAFIGQLFFHRITLNENEINDLIDVKIKDINNEKINEWLTIEKTKNSVNLIGLPGNEDKGMHFINVEFIKKNNRRINDVFLFDVFDGYFMKDDDEYSSTNSKEYCQVKITPVFTDINQVWIAVKHLMPLNIILHLNNNENKNIENTNEFNRNTKDSIKIIHKWLSNNIIINSFINDGKKLFELSLDLKQHNHIYLDGIMTKLNQNSFKYHLIKCPKNNLYNKENNDKINSFDDKNNIINDKVNNKIKYQFKRNVNIEPSINSDHLIGTTVLPHENEIDADFNMLSRKLPEGMSLSHTSPTMNIEPTPILPKHRGIGATFVYKTPALFPEIPTHIFQSSTIAYKSYSPNVQASQSSIDVDLIKSTMLNILPTPTFDSVATVITAATTTQTTEQITTESTTQLTTTDEVLTTTNESTTEMTTVLTTDSTNQPIISTVSSMATTYFDSTETTPSQNATVTLSTAINVETTTNNDTTTTTTVVYNPVITEKKVNLPIPPNKKPEIKNRLSILKAVAGLYWKYKIPEDTFTDFEDGNTRSLELDLRTIDKKQGNKSISKDSWIYLNKKEQYLYAIPTEKNAGRLQFLLVGIDSNGEEVYEDLSIRVQQHPSFRKFHHIFTLNGLNWKSNNYQIRLDAISEIFIRIANYFSQDSLEQFNFQEISGDSKNASVSWTMTSLTFDKCPKEELNNIFKKLKSDEKIQDGYKPNIDFIQILHPEFDVKSVNLKFLEICDESDLKSELSIRNKLNGLKFKYGEVISYRIPDDTFFMPSNRRPELTLLTAEGEKLAKNLYISFDSYNKTINGIAFDESDVRYKKTFKLIAKDAITGKMVENVFAIDFEDEEDLKYSYEFKISLIPINSDDDKNLSTERTINLMNKIAYLFDDKDASLLKVLQFNHYLLKPYIRKEKHLENDLDQNNHNKVSLLENNFFENNNNLQRNTRQSPSEKLYYEIIWTNKTEYFVNNKCSIDELQSINEKIFNPNVHLEDLKKHFAPDYELINIHFKTTGVCKEYINEKEMGMKLNGELLAKRPYNIDKLSSTTSLPPGLNEVKNIDEKYDAYYLRTIVPAISIIAAMLILSCIIVLILLRYRRKQEKTRFGLGSDEPRSTGSFGSEREAFLKKGRSPVILESELQMSHLHGGNTVIMPPKDDPTTTPNFSPARNINKIGKTAYQPLRQQRPPPYQK